MPISKNGSTPVNAASILSIMTISRRSSKRTSTQNSRRPEESTPATLRLST